MKAVAILLLAFVAMAASQVNVVDNNNPGGVNVVDNSDPNKVHVVEQPGQGIDSAFYRPSAHSGGGNGGINPERPSIDPAFVVDQGFYQPSYPNAPNIDPAFVDPAFGRPSVGGNNGPYQQQWPYPPKQYSFPGARNGK